MLYRTIYADPPWRICTGGIGKKWGTPQNHYPTMKTEDIKNLSVPYDINEQAHIYMWVVNNLLKEGIEVLEHWGFKYITNMVWVKDRIGMGQYIRGQHELLLFGRRGKPLPYRYNEEGKRVTIPSVLHAPKTQHSRKPLEFYDIIEQISYPPYLELFARHPDPREHWTYWGNEVAIA